MPLAGTHQGVAPRHPVVGHTTQVDGDPVAGAHPRVGVAVALEGAHPHPLGPPGAVPGHQQQLVVDGQRPAAERARDHGARSLGREGAVDPQPGTPPVRGRGRDVEQAVEGGSQLVQAAPADAVDGHHLDALEEGRRHAVRYL